MEIVIHRVNTSQQLRQIPSKYGIEIDLRANGSNLILNHEPFKSGENFAYYLEQYQHGLLVLNIKEAGIESEVLKLVERYKIKNYFLLDIEFPYIYKKNEEGFDKLAIRFSEKEPIENLEQFSNLDCWAWIDTNTRLPITEQNLSILQNFKTCLVCPERWGRPQDIPLYRQQLKELSYEPSAVMTALSHVEAWESNC